MAVVKNRFRNPVNDDTYTWHINHGWGGEQRSGGELALSFATTTAGNPIPQYGELQPESWTLSGTILHRAQHEEFVEWAALCATQTIYFRDFDNAEYEVVITAYRPKREGVMRNSNDASMPYHIFRYELTMTILREIT